jgi:ELWxxDGT repeat protein
MRNLIFSYVAVLLTGLSFSQDYEVVDGEPGTSGKSVNPTSVIALNGNLFFVANDPEASYEWHVIGPDFKSDTLLKDISISPNHLYCWTCTVGETSINDSLLAFTAESDEYGYELFVSDGTPEGTRVLKDIKEGTSSSFPGAFYPDGNLLYFVAWGESSANDVWVTDGTEAGTRMIMDQTTTEGIDGLRFNDLVTLPGDNILLSSNYALHVFDTVNNTIDTLFEVNQDTFHLDLELINEDLVYFTKTSDDADQLWVTNGSAEGTELLYNASERISGVYVFGDKVLLHLFIEHYANSDLYILNESTQDATMLKNIDPSPSDMLSYIGPKEITVADGYVFFSQGNSTYGEEPYITDGTSEGTFLLSNIREFGSSTPEDAVAWGNYIFFEADNSTNGKELWVTNGTSEGTEMLFDIFPGSNGSSPAYMTVAGDYLYWNAYSEDYGREFFRYDLNQYTTTPIKDNIAPLNLSVYPNPFESKFEIKGEEISESQLFDVSGNEIDISNGTSNLPSGTYILRLVSPRGMYTEVITKK